MNFRLYNQKIRLPDKFQSSFSSIRKSEGRYDIGMVGPGKPAIFINAVCFLIVPFMGR